MSRPKGSKNKPKVAAQPVPVATDTEVKKTAKRAKQPNEVTPAPVQVVEQPKVDWSPLSKLVKSVYDLMPAEQQHKWQQPVDNPDLKTPEDKITAVLVEYFHLDGFKVQNSK